MEIRVTSELLGEEVEADMSAWLVSDGAMVEEGEAIAELETSKVVVTIQAPASGVIHQRVQVGDLLEVDAIVATMEVRAK